MSYTMYTPLNVWLDPASVTDVVAYIQTYLSENPIYSETEIETIIHDYLIAHPELIGGVQSVNGKTGTVVLSASDINTANNVTIESVLASLSSQISSIAASVATNTNNITSLTGRMTTAETDLTNLKSNFDNTRDELNYIDLNGNNNPNANYKTSSQIRVYPNDVIFWSGALSQASYACSIRVIKNGSSSVIAVFHPETTGSGIQNYKNYRFVVPDNNDGILKAVFSSQNSAELEVSVLRAENPIVEQNDKAIRAIMSAKRRLGETSNYGKNTLLLAHISDMHTDVKRWTNFVKFVNRVSPDIVLHTGDIVELTGLDDSDYMLNDLPDAPTLVAVGNHDVGNGADIGSGGLTNAQAFSRYITPLNNKYGFEFTGLDYYYDIKNVRIIVLNVYGYDAHEGNVFNTRKYTFRQEQIDWFTQTMLDANTKGIPVIVAAHESDRILVNASGEGPFNQVTPNTYFTTKVWSGCPICDIINAFIEGTSHSATYSQAEASASAPSLTVNCNFPNTGEFICWFVGHRHSDQFGFLKQTYAKQLAITVTCGTCTKPISRPANYYNDIPRFENTPTENAFNFVAIDTENKTVKLIRIGSDLTIDFSKRDYYMANYQPE